MDTGGTAVVIGASMGGLLAARALSETFARVVLIDRDVLPAEASERRGVPQSRQLHVLLARGRQELDDLFPGLSGELSGAGAPLIDLHDDVHWFNDGYLMQRAPSSLIAIGISRPRLEHAVRARVAALPRVELHASCEVTGLTTTPDRSRVTGLRVRPRGSEGPDERIEADLVVDAGGRGSRTPVWLEELGYPRPAEENVRIDVHYLTRIYQAEPQFFGGLSGVLVNPVPGTPRGAVAGVQENGQVAVALTGMGRDEPPADDEELARFAETLAAPQVAEVIRTGTPITEPARMRYPASTRRHYEQLARFPEGYLVFGDALCSFNPVYGQGMTVAAMEAQLLRRLLAGGAARRPKLAETFHRAASRIIDGPWAIAVGTDLRFPEVNGRRTLKVRFVNAYVHRLHRAATSDPALGSAFLRVLNLIDPPTALLAPRTLLRVLLGGRGATVSTPATAGIVASG
jgi:2-polyprenyl-6-methoxyphenol hydroxylase-like FAD-dependent oxidoreductase